MFIRSEVIEWFRDLFPPSAVYDVTHKNEDLIIRILWNESELSRTVQMRISKEALADYLTRDEYRKSARELLREFIEAKRRKLKSDETWQVTTNLFALL